MDDAAVGPLAGAWSCVAALTDRRRSRFLVELVGLAGVGKSHLARELAAHLGTRCVTVRSPRRSLRSLVHLPVAVARVAPLCWYVLVCCPREPVVRLRYAVHLVHHAWAEEAALRAPGPAEYVLAEEGWFHKLRRLRKIVEPTTTFDDLPAAVRARLFRADAVVFLTADPEVICERKLRRTGRAVTARSLREQHERMAHRGQWAEDELTRKDLAQAVEANGLCRLEIDYGPSFDVAIELVPVLEQLRAERETHLRTPEGEV